MTTFRSSDKGQILLPGLALLLILVAGFIAFVQWGETLYRRCAWILRRMRRR